MIRSIGFRPIIFSVNCYVATILAMFVTFRLDLKSLLGDDNRLYHQPAAVRRAPGEGLLSCHRPLLQAIRAYFPGRSIALPTASKIKTEAQAASCWLP